ncbi:MAG TPA: PQQ-binding-like beta-propeller repeat protein, partial [Humisphaera sp.]
MRTCRRLTVVAPALVVAVVLSFAARAPAQSRTDPVTATPAGPYAVARLELSAGLQAAKDKEPAGTQALFVGLRDGKLAYAWFVRPIAGDSRLMVERSSLALTDAGLTGAVDFRTASNRGSKQVDVKLSLDLKRAGDKLTGTFDIAGDGAVYKPAKGTAAGTLSTAAGPADALAPAGSWTSFYGTAGDMSAGPQPPHVTGLAKARPVWRSETYVPTAYGNAPDSRYFTRAVVSGNGGGGSSPVVAGGTVYMYYYVPSPQSEPALKGNPFWEKSYKDDAAFKDAMAKMNATDREVGQLMNHFRPLADDHVVALDAATGAEKWHAVLPLRSPNLQTHKHRGISGVPLVDGDTLYVPNLGGRLYAVDAKTGKLKWESPAFKPDAKAQDAKAGVKPSPTPSPMLLGGTLVFARGSWFNGTVHGLDPATGAERWKVPGGYFLRWSA